MIVIYRQCNLILQLNFSIKHEKGGKRLVIGELVVILHQIKKLTLI